MIGKQLQRLLVYIGIRLTISYPAPVIAQETTGTFNLTQTIETALKANLSLKQSKEEVNAALRKHWQTDNLFVTIVTDTSEAQPLADALINNTPSPMSYSNLVAEGLSDAIKAEDALVATYPLNVKTVEIIESKNTFKTRHPDQGE